MLDVQHAMTAVVHRTQRALSGCLTGCALGTVIIAGAYTCSPDNPRPRRDDTHLRRQPAQRRRREDPYPTE